jgi:hypothetical protein
MTAFGAGAFPGRAAAFPGHAGRVNGRLRWRSADLHRSNLGTLAALAEACAAVVTACFADGGGQVRTFGI